MKRLRYPALMLVVAGAAFGQQPSFFATGIKVVGGERCPLFVGDVLPGSPAAVAQIRSGDLLTAVDGTTVTTVQGAGELLHAETSKPVTLQLVRGETPYTVTINRESSSILLQRQGLKLLESGMIVPLDATESEMKDKMQVIKHERFVDRVFPSHYPSNAKVYYPGFEVLVLKNPTQVVVLGIEDGPASRAGVHWGDVILSVNRTDPRNRSIAELESLFSSQKPAPMTLTIERGGVTKNFSFQLVEAAQVLLDNGFQLFKGHVVPLGVPEQYLSCFE